MELIKRLDKMVKKGHSMVPVGIFKCPVCGKEIEKPIPNGEVNFTCSRSCGNAFRAKPTGRPKKEKVEKKIEPPVQKTATGEINIFTRAGVVEPKLCKTCYYFRNLCSYDNCIRACHHLYDTGVAVLDRDCEKFGFYKPKGYKKHNGFNYRRR